MNVIQKIKVSAFDTKAGLKLREIKWRYVKNFRPTLSSYFDKPVLTEEQKRVVKTIERDGVSITNIKDLFGDEHLFNELVSAVVKEEKKQAKVIAEARKLVGDMGPEKTFTRELLGDSPIYDPESIFVRFSLYPPIVAVAEAYFRMKVKLRWFNVWRTFISTGPLHLSQFWHRDPGDYHMLTVFVYLDDVDANTGPFMYAKGSHPKGKYGLSHAEFFKEEGRNNERSNDEQMAKIVPKEEWLTAIGKKGTIVIGDNQGYHKGGYATSRERLLFAFYFTSYASSTQDRFTMMS